MLALVKAGNVGAVVVLKLDRAFRNVADALATVDAWETRGVGLHIADMGGSAMDTTSAMGRMFLTLMAGFAEFERNLGAERTTAALAQKARSGNMRTSSTPPYGWRYVGVALVEVAPEQAVIARVRTLRAAGVSLRGIGAELATLGMRNRAGGPFAPVQVVNILRGSVRQLHAASARP